MHFLLPDQCFEVVGINGVWALHVGKYYISNLHEIDLYPLHWYLIYVGGGAAPLPSLSLSLLDLAEGQRRQRGQMGGGWRFFRLKQFRKQVAIAFVKMEIPSAKIIFADGTNIRLQKSCIFAGGVDSKLKKSFWTVCKNGFWCRKPIWTFSLIGRSFYMCTFQVEGEKRNDMIYSLRLAPFNFFPVNVTFVLPLFPKEYDVLLKCVTS